MQLAHGAPLSWCEFKQTLTAGLYRLWKHPFSARHYPRSDELKGVSSSFDVTSHRYMQFVHNLGDEKQIAVQLVDPVVGGPPLQDLILYQDERTYRLPVMMQVVMENFVLQGSLLLEHPYSPGRINSRELFGFWETVCNCEDMECVVVLPEQVSFGEDLDIWPGCFIRVRCGPGRLEQTMDVSSCSTASGSSASGSDKTPFHDGIHLEENGGAGPGTLNESQVQVIPENDASFYSKLRPSLPSWTSQPRFISFGEPIHLCRAWSD